MTENYILVSDEHIVQKSWVYIQILWTCSWYSSKIMNIYFKYYDHIVQNFMNTNMFIFFIFIWNRMHIMVMKAANELISWTLNNCLLIKTNLKLTPSCNRFYTHINHTQFRAQIKANNRRYLLIFLAK